MYVYITSKCEDKANSFGIQEQLKELRVAIETQGNVAVQSRFDRNFPYLKRVINKNLRIVAKLISIDNHPILCFLDIFKRGGNDYEHDFLKNPEGYGRQYLEPLIDGDELRKWLRSQQLDGNANNGVKPLPDELYCWLQRPGLGTEKTDWTIYESEAWVNRFKQPDTKKYWQNYYAIVEKLLEGNAENGTIQEKSNWLNVYLAREQRDERYVLYSRIVTTDTPPRKVLFLLAPFLQRPSEAEIAEIGRISHLFDRESRINILAEPLSLDNVARYARRSYVDYLLADKDIWHDIESGNGVNLALSAEEEQILSSVSTPGAENKSLPIFINGRAGSGKSLMLFYLFADYCYRYQKHSAEMGEDGEETAHPLFLTYNEKLLEKAKEEVGKLLEAHHQYLLEKRNNNGKKTLDRFFQPFQKFLLNLLPPEASDRFDREKYISFHQFRKQYEKKFFNSYSPEMCWHAIRTFIKGYHFTESGAEYMDPEGYREVPKKERSIADETFDKIYERVWPWYCKLTTKEGYWDDCDLIAKVLELKSYRPKYTAIFCDEAQDFTRLELRLIVQLSVFSQYDLFPPVESLPFAFAGDPFQTLNPTGFRWESVKAVFFDRVIATVDPMRQLNIEMNFQELERNYRSSPAIVKVTNSIHLWRHVLFGIPDLKPQIPWQEGEAIAPQKFIFGENISSTELKRHVDKDPIFIVPCEDGGEIEYIKNDEFLGELFPDLEEGVTPKNVLSAIQAKGLEFPLVILYKFGDRFAAEYGKTLWELAEDSDRHNAVEVEYFFNKLYVAASRGMSETIAIDSIDGDRCLWQYATDRDAGGIERWIERAQDPTLWENYVGNLRFGDTLELLDRDNRESQAKEFKQNGLSQENPDFLRRAKQFYQVLGYGEEAELCETWALKFEKQFREAGKRFLKLNQPEDAWNCFWQGMCWEELQQWDDRESSHRFERPIVTFMTQPQKDLTAIEEFTEFLEECAIHNRLKVNRLSKPWKAVTEEYARQIRTAIDTLELEAQHWQRWGNILQDLAEAGYGLKEILDCAGYCFYRFEDYGNAVKCWKRCQAIEKREYYLAQAEVLGFPDGLPYLEMAQQSDRIVLEWEKAGKPGTKQWLQYVKEIGRALEAQHRYGDSIEYLVQVRYWVEAIEALDRCPDSDVNSLRFYIVGKLARSSLTPDRARERRSVYMEFMEKLQKMSEWRSHLSVQEVGTAMEKIGKLVPTLEFYEKFISDGDPQIQQFARSRWLATKKKQLIYSGGTRETNRTQEIRQEIVNKARSWQLDAAAIPLDPPRLPPLPNEESAGEMPADMTAVKPAIAEEEIAPLPSPSAPPEPESGHWIEGLPSGTPVKQLAAALYSFQTGHLEVKTTKNDTALSIAIANLFTSKGLQVYVGRKKARIKIGEMLIEGVDGSQLSFKDSSGEYSGVAYYQSEHPRIELNISGFSTRIIFRL